MLRTLCTENEINICRVNREFFSLIFVWSPSGMELEGFNCCERQPPSILHMHRFLFVRMILSTRMFVLRFHHYSDANAFIFALMRMLLASALPKSMILSRDFLKQLGFLF